MPYFAVKGKGNSFVDESQGLAPVPSAYRSDKCDMMHAILDLNQRFLSSAQYI